MGKKTAVAPAVSQPAAKVQMTEEARIQHTKDIQKAFSVFDTLSNNTCEFREVGTILRSLNIYPSVETLAASISQMEEVEPTGYIKFEKFIPVALKLIHEDVARKASEEDLYRAFLTLDSEKKGYLFPEELKAYLMGDGEAFTEDEAEEMIGTFTDPAEGRIYYEDYVVMVSKK